LALIPDSRPRQHADRCRTVSEARGPLTDCLGGMGTAVGLFRRQHADRCQTVSASDVCVQFPAALGISTQLSKHSPGSWHHLRPTEQETRRKHDKVTSDAGWHRH